MQKIAGVGTRDLRWSQPHAVKMDYELRSGSELVATLAFRSAFGTLATAESGDGCWTFKRVGFWQNRASIRVSGSETDLALFKNSTWDNGGTLEYPDGRKVKATTNFWRTNLEFTTEADEPLIRFKCGGLLHRSADVEISPEARDVPEVPLFVLFGWYLIIMLDTDAGVSTAIAAT